MNGVHGEIDAPIRELVRVLNEIPTVTTIGSCGGHENGEPGGIHAAANEWWVTFEIEPAEDDAETTAPSPQAWLDLEFLAYEFNTSGLSSVIGRSLSAQLAPYAPAPFLNEPGRMLRFDVRGYRDGDEGIEPDEIATALATDLAELYRPDASD